MASFCYVRGEHGAHSEEFNWTDSFTLYLCQNQHNNRQETSLTTVLATAVPLTATNYANKLVVLSFFINGNQAQRRLPQPLEWQNVAQGDPTNQAIRSAVLGIPSLDIPLAHFQVSPERLTNGEDVRAIFGNADYLINVL